MTAQRIIKLVVLLDLLASPALGQGVSTYINRTYGFMTAHPSTWRVMPSLVGGEFFLVDAKGDTMVDLKAVRLKDENAYSRSLDRWRDFAVDQMLSWLFGSSESQRSHLRRLMQFENEHEARIIEMYIEREDSRYSKGAIAAYFAVDISTSPRLSAVLVSVHGKPDDDKIQTAKDLVANMRAVLSEYPYERSRDVPPSKDRD